MLFMVYSTRLGFPFILAFLLHTFFVVLFYDVKFAYYIRSHINCKRTFYKIKIYILKTYYNTLVFLVHKFVKDHYIR